MQIVKGIFILVGISVNTVALSEPALTLPGEVNYGESCQINVVVFCESGKCHKQETRLSENTEGKSKSVEKPPFI